MEAKCRLKAYQPGDHSEVPDGCVATLHDLRGAFFLKAKGLSSLLVAKRVISLPRRSAAGCISDPGGRLRRHTDAREDQTPRAHAKTPRRNFEDLLCICACGGRVSARLADPFPQQGGLVVILRKQH